MKSRPIAVAALVMLSGIAMAQRSIVSLNTTNELASRTAISGETVTVLNQTSATNYGPSRLWRHVPTANLTPGDEVIPAIPSGQWLAVTDPVGSGSGSGGFNGILACSDDSTTHLLTVTKVGSNYVLNVGQSDAGAGTYPSAVAFIADDASVHALRVSKYGTNYVLTLSQ